MASLHLRRRLAICCLLGQLFSAGQSLDLLAAEPGSDSTVTAPTDLKQAGEEGIASYYAKRYHNKRTNSGQRYNAAGLTAAHPTLPLRSKVRVINLSNNKEVVVTINDRCRSRSGPFIDLSRAAAKQLGFLGKGKTRVRIIPLDKEQT